jgi:hypothetical protein
MHSPELPPPRGLHQSLKLLQYLCYLQNLKGFAFHASLPTIAMGPLHITEFASKRYFDKLRQLNDAAGANRDAADGRRGSPALESATSSVAAIIPPTFTLPLGRPRPLVVERSPLHRPEKRHNFRRSLGALTAKRESITKTSNSFSSISSDSENSEAIR